MNIERLADCYYPDDDTLFAPDRTVDDGDGNKRSDKKPDEFYQDWAEELENYSLAGNAIRAIAEARGFTVINGTGGYSIPKQGSASSKESPKLRLVEGGRHN